MTALVVLVHESVAEEMPTLIHQRALHHVNQGQHEVH